MVTKRCPLRESKQSETRTNDLRDRLVSCKEEEEEEKEKEEERRRNRGRGKEGEREEERRGNDESGARALRQGEEGGRARSFSEIGSCKFRSRPGNSEKRRQFALSQPLSRGSVMKRTVMRRPPDFLTHRRLRIKI